MNKFKTVIKDVYNATNKISFITTIFVVGCSIIAPTLVTMFCTGWCCGICVADTLHNYMNDKYK